MKSNDGGWTLQEAGPGRTRATYSVEVGFGLLVPKSVSGFLTERNLPKMLEAFKKRAEGLARK
jgi:ribosome-associated toxin RatA of RatAB toxin-antitoxin module